MLRTPIDTVVEFGIFSYSLVGAGTAPTLQGETEMMTASKSAARLAALEHTLSNDRDVMTPEQVAEIERAIAKLNAALPVIDVAPAKTITSEVTSMLTERCMPYLVKMSCGHVESRLMRPATAGIPWSEGATVDNTRGATCKACREATVPATPVESTKVAAENAKRVAAGKPKMTAAEAKEFEMYSETNANIVEAACENGCEAYVDVFTFNRWIAQGFAVRKGEKATRITVWQKKQIRDAQTGEMKWIRTSRQVPVFCRCAVEPIKRRRAA